MLRCIHAVKSVQAQVLMKELAAVVDAETGSAMSDYTLLRDMNRLAEAKYADMVQHVESLQPTLTVTPPAYTLSDPDVIKRVQWILGCATTTVSKPW